MEVTSLIGRPVKILTIDEYKEAIKEYYTTSGNEDKVVWFFSGNGYKFLTKFRTFEEVGQIYWKHEPLMKRWFSSLEDCLANLNRSGGMCGTSMRWLPGNGASQEEVVLQPTIIPSENTEGYIDKMTDTALQDRMFGLLMDPFVYVTEFGDGKYIDEEDPRYGVLDNYRVFSMEITREEYEKMEKEYVESIRTFKYDDGLLRKDNWKSFEMTEEFIEFMKQHTHYKFEDDED
jgi:hypothetical protein